jgi:group I intron endonuclease
VITIYLVYNESNGKGYLGQTKFPIQVRWRQHLSNARRGCKYPLHCAIRKHGPGAFEISEIGKCFSREQASRFERALIVSLRKHVLGCYNATNGGEGLSPTPETREKMRQSMLRCKYPDDIGKRISEGKLKVSKITDQRVEELYGSGISVAEVGRRLGVDGGTIRLRLRKLRIPIRPCTWEGRRHCSETKLKIKRARLKWWLSSEGKKRKEEMCRVKSVSLTNP